MHVDFVIQDDVIRDLASRNEVVAEIRQFACKQCDNMWWRKVPSRKPVSRCKKCRERLDAIPVDKQFGWALFRCHCGHEFRAFGMMEMSELGKNVTGPSSALCYDCLQKCSPIQILPPLRVGRRFGRYQHKCTAMNCYNRMEPAPGVAIVPICVHPKSMEARVLFASLRHTSTGSTVNTFLTQDDLLDSYSQYEPVLADIEDDSDENSASDSST